MGLLSINISKEKKLSIKDVKLTAPTIKVNGPSSEEVAYNKLIELNPHVKKMAVRLDLVSSVNEKQIEVTPQKTPPVSKQVDKDKLIALAIKILEPERTYRKSQIIDILQTQTRASLERAEMGFTLMFQVKAIEQTADVNLFYLANSTPF